MKIVVIGVADFVANLVREMTDRGHQVAVFDDAKEGVEKLEAELDVTGAVVDLLNFDELEEFGFSKADVLVLTHRDDTINVVLSMYAKMVNIPRVLVVSKSKKIAEVIQKLGLASSVLTIESLVGKAVTSALLGAETIELPGDSLVAALDTKVISQLVGISIADLRDKWRLTVLRVIDREGILRELADEYVVKEGDIVLVVAERTRIKELLL